MKDPKTMTNEQLVFWMTKSSNTCYNTLQRHSDYETARAAKCFVEAEWRFYDCAEEFDERGLKIKDYTPYDYASVGYNSEFFTDGLA